MKKLLIPIAAIILIAVCLFPTGEDMKIYDSLIRLHVIADSDSPRDQELKLKVRDALLSEVAALTENCGSRDEAEALLRDNAEYFEEISERTLRENGSDDSVTVSVGWEKYPERSYEGLRLPSGEYCSMRVMIGEAEGKNWWCVLFPPLCVGSATEVEEKLVSVGFTPDQVKVLTDTGSPKYRIRFKILDVLGSIFS